jgi:hypothetical protein
LAAVEAGAAESGCNLVCSKSVKDLDAVEGGIEMPTSRGFEAT